MSGTLPFSDPAYVTVRCDLTLDDVQATAVRMVHREIWSDHSGARAHVERELQLGVAQKIVEKLAPSVFEVRADTLCAEEHISRAEALRLAQAYTKAIADLSARLEAAGENYAVMDACRAADAGRALVEKLAGYEGRLPVRPGEGTSA
ncbi:hypothetical protein [Streptomyces scabiei]|uniref:hypothetical protein n=1 Tax=Streptomyces scabiei TaxID=1930 RepID=UPI0007658EDC|nr:hypothetical protein [Streptomyces scabiei]